MHIARLIVLLAMLITTPIASVASVVEAAPGDTDAGLISVNPDLQSDGISMVWSDGMLDMLVPPAPEASDIWIANINDPYPERVTLDDRRVRQSDPDVSGDIVVWTEWSRDGDDGASVPSSVWIKDLSIGIETRVASDASNIVIEGNWIAYRRGSTLIVSNLHDMSDSWSVRIGEPDVSVFRLSDGWAAWVEKVYPVHPTDDLSTRYPQPGNWPTFKLYAMRLPDGAPQLIYEYVDYADFGLAWWDLAGDTLAYQRMRGNPIAVMLDLPTGAQQSVVLDRGFSGPSYRIATNGRYLFWVIPFDVTKGDLYAYDSYAGSMFPTGLGVHFWANLVTRGPNIIWTPGIYEPPSEIDDVHIRSVASVLPSAPRPDPERTDPRWTWYPETGHYLAWDFRDYWNANGGVPVFGYPMTEEFSERNADTGLEHTVQFTERQRFEWHPENDGTPYEVLLGRLGAELLAVQGRDWTTFPTADARTPHYMPETGHAIAPEFWDYWSTHGLDFGDPNVSFRESLALFGYPLSEAMVETNVDGDTVLTQYFERAIFEYHPDNPSPWKVLLRRAGAEHLIVRGWSLPTADDVNSFAFQSSLSGWYPGPPLRLQLLLGDQSTLLTLDELNGVALPEAGACYFTELEGFLLDQLNDPYGASLVVEGVDRYEFDMSWAEWMMDGVDRIWLNGSLLNEILLLNGFARLNAGDPDPLFQSRLVRAEQRAANLDRGIWDACNLR